MHTYRYKYITCVDTHPYIFVSKLRRSQQPCPRHVIMAVNPAAVASFHSVPGYWENEKDTKRSETRTQLNK